MSEFTREQIIEAAKHCSKTDDISENDFSNCNGCPFFGQFCTETFVKFIVKENEPAPAEAGTSSKNNNSSNYDDNMICRNCQAQLLKKLELIEQVLNLYLVEDDEVNIPMLSAIIGEAYGMLRMIELDLERTESR